VPLVTVWLRFVARYEIEDRDAARREYRRIREEDAKTGRALVVCANHLTLIDSAIIAWALGSPGWYLLHYSSLPWNVPERRNFAVSLGQRFATYVMKCLPITRGGNRGDVARVLAEFAWLLSRGDVGLVFPEAGRSRTGRIDVEAATPGVGRVIRSVSGCRVLCVYLRGRGQRTFSDYPLRGERFRVALRLVEPKSAHDGLRGSRDVSRQILAELASMEESHFRAG
jgi:1-acyl-sn-glycerol-3-phosphate acyltransferase